MRDWIPVSLMLFSMTLVFIIAWRYFNSFRAAFIAMLLVGTKWTIILSLFGYDRVLFTLYFINKRNPWIVKAVNVTVCEVITLSYVLSLVFVLVYPLFFRRLPENIRREIKELELRGGKG